jgi:glycosyltransferase involved in cell wall biosynthesis
VFQLSSDSRPGRSRAATSAMVAICTHNRVEDADLCLTALVPQAEESGLSVLLVDSGSDPANAARLRQLALAHKVEHVRIDTPGLSLARNAAHQHASTDWIVFLDDDAIPEPNWASSLVLTLCNVSAEVAIVGGKISPMWPVGSDRTNTNPR